MNPYKTPRKSMGGVIIALVKTRIMPHLMYMKPGLKGDFTDEKSAIMRV
jgi:hypothetical protein